MTNDSSATVAADRSRRLFEYLSKVAQLQSVVVRDITSSIAYETVEWLGDLPDAPEVRSALRGDPGIDGEWLIVTRPRFIPPPKPSDVLEPWLAPSAIRDSSAPLRLKETTTIIVDRVDDAGEIVSHTETIALADHPEVEEEFEEFLPEWDTWATEDRRLQPIHDVYARLHDIEQRVRILQELYELALGVGLVTSGSGTVQVKRHLIVAKADIHLDPESGTITVGPAGDGIDLHLEDEMIEATELPPGEIIRDITQRLTEVDDPLIPDAVAAHLRSWANASSDDSRYDASPREPRSADGLLTITHAPALLFRRRTRRSIVDFCQGVLDEIGANPSLIPGAIRDLVEQTDASLGSTEGHGSSDAPVPVEVLFPLPANDEQREILERLERADGIVVEGPPGTGKSHTIANLVAHLTATGQRVLVTSHTARALMVLRDKLPPGIADLCVDVLGEGQERRANLERSITELLSRRDRAEWTPKHVRDRIEALRQERQRLKDERSGLLAELRQLRELEVTAFDPEIGDYRGSLSHIAERLRTETERFDWLEDPADGPPPALLATLTRLLELCRRVDDAELSLAASKAPEPRSLPTPLALRRAWEATDIASSQVGATSRRAALLAAAKDVDPAGLTNMLRAVISAQRDARRSPAPWAPAAAQDVLRHRETQWVELATRTSEALAAVSKDVSRLDGVILTGVTAENHGRLWAQADALHRHLVAGGNLGSIISKPDVVRDATELLSSVRLDGRTLRSVADVATVVAWITTQSALGQAEVLWGANLRHLGPTFELRRTALAAEAEELGRVIALRDPLRAFEAATHAVPGVLDPDWEDDRSVADFLADVDQAQRIREVASARSVLEEQLRPLLDLRDDQAAASSVRLALRAVDTRDAAGYETQLGEFMRIAEAKQHVAMLDRGVQALTAVTPRMVAAIRGHPHDERWDTRLTNIVAAWEWRRAQDWISGMTGGRSMVAIGTQLSQLDAAIQGKTADLVQNQAWQQALGRLDGTASANLRAYQTAMGKYGKGTGRHAQRHLAEARRFLDACQDAVPVWIMPTHLVAQTIRPKPAQFDVVIVDEASQSGVDSSFLLWLGRKVVIVGDERQISPDNVGIDRDQAERLAQTYLFDFHFRSILSVDNSLFTQAAVRFGGRIRLREHFRCMPEIIQFSNEVAYADAPLIPLRQYGTGRLDPLVARFVEGAETRGGSGSTVNDREAEQIVHTIERLCADPAYDGKTMGVVTLLGSAQARLINDRLVRTLSPEELAARKLRCGDAYAFQGDERDVVFLSMVAAPDGDGLRLPSANPRIFLQRYNVATSRARDQEWLFHSVTMDDLRPEDLRRKLLTHFLSPQSGLIEQELQDIPDDERIDPFDSVFEQRVYKEIRRRGYRVHPQFDVHGYRIDLVIAGRDRRLAVECDGDRWHGPERYDADQARQRDLERVGWSFVRIRGSDYYRDPGAALEPLWTALDRYGIQPPESDLDTVIPVADSESEWRSTTPELDDEWAVTDEPIPGEAPQGASETPLVIDGSTDELAIDVEESAAIEAIPSQSTHVAARAASTSHDSPVEPAVTTDQDVAVADVAPAMAGMAAPIVRVVVPAEPADTRGASGLPAYLPWTPDDLLPSLGSRGMNGDRLAHVITEIVAVEGPVLGEVVYRRLAKATGALRVTPGVRKILNPALHLALRRMWVDSNNPTKTTIFSSRVLIRPGGGYVEVRDRGDRELEDIPPDEVAAVARMLQDREGITGREALKRAVLDVYGRSRLTDRASRYLDTCLTLTDARGVADAARRISALPLPRPTHDLSGAVDVPHETEQSPRQGVARDVEASVTATSESAVGAVVPFWEVVFEVLRRGKSLSSQRNESLGLLWAQADGPEAKHLRMDAIDAGAEPDWTDVAHLVTRETPGLSGDTRGALVDVAYIEYAMQVPASGLTRDDLGPWARRLFEMWRRSANAPSSLDLEVTPVARCIHGSPPAQCQAPSCPHHALGGIDLHEH